MSNTADSLATISGVQSYLDNKLKFAAHTVERLSGGFGNFVYRVHLRKALGDRQTLVLKYAPSYAAASGGDFPLDQKRQGFEVQALRLARQLCTANVPTFITVPAIHLFDEEKHVIIMDDIGQGCRTLKQLLIEESLPQIISEQIGDALGKFISNVHTWHRSPHTDLTLFANNQVGKDITAWITYGRLKPTLNGELDTPALTDPLLDVAKAKMTTVEKVAEKRQQGIRTASSSDPVTHGDFWPGNIVVLLRRGADGIAKGVEKIYVLDWELVKTGLPGLDLGQFCAEMYTLSEFFPARDESTRAIIGSFLGAYREQMGTGRDTELSRMVMSHIGAHLIAITPRVKTWAGREKTRDVVAKGVEMMVLGEEGSELALRESIVASILLDP